MTRFTLLRNTIRAHKGLSSAITLFLGIVGVMVFFKQCSTKKVHGNWYFELKVEKSNYRPFLNETHTQKVFFIQNDEQVEGDGEKWEYNGHFLPAHAHRKVEYKGRVDGDLFFATYVLHGLKRVSEGSVRMTVSEDGNFMEGTFTGTAGGSSGTIRGRRLED